MPLGSGRAPSAARTLPAGYGFKGIALRLILALLPSRSLNRRQRPAALAALTATHIQAAVEQFMGAICAVASAYPKGSTHEGIAFHCFLA